MELPLFPLHTVLYPGVALPLHVFEPRYRALVAACLASGEPFGVVLIREGREVGGGSTSIATVGTTAEIREAEALEDGRYRILAVGGGRFRIDSVTVGREPYLVGRVEPVADVVGDPLIARHLTERVTQRFLRYLTLLQPGEGEDAETLDIQVEVDLDETQGEASLASSSSRSSDADQESGSDDRLEELDEVARRAVIPDDPTVLSYLLSGILQVDQPRRQELLEAASTEDRLRGLLRLIDREVLLLERRLRNYAVDPRQAMLRRN